MGVGSAATLGCVLLVSAAKTTQPGVAVLLMRLHALGFQDWHN
jgi:hypothetical protein